VVTVTRTTRGRRTRVQRFTAYWAATPWRRAVRGVFLMGFAYGLLALVLPKWVSTVVGLGVFVAQVLYLRSMGRKHRLDAGQLVGAYLTASLFNLLIGLIILLLVAAVMLLILGA